MTARRPTTARSTRKRTANSRAGRQDRTETENRELTDEERLALYRQNFYQSSLPDLPNLPGYHVCWLTTTNARDPIHGRMRLGYTPVRDSDIPGWEESSIKSGEFAGCIGVNEMVAFKLPMTLYESYMRETHHDQPLAEEEKLVTATKDKQQEMNALTRSPVIIEAESGQQELGVAPEPPSFAETLGE